MKKYYYLLFCLFSFSLMKSQSWQLVWSDEFTTVIGPDWVFETGGGGWGNAELEYYRQQNATVQGGQLVITAKQESFGGMNYTSARMKTQGHRSWKYGKVEARISMPAFQGIWPAFWMLGDTIASIGWPKCGETDIMEHINTGGQVNGTIHWATASGNATQYGGTTTTTVTGYHVYSVEWDSSSIKWYVDSVLYNTANILNNINNTDAFHHPFFIILNMAVGGNWPGPTIDNTGFPAAMYVDYVRVYQRNSLATGLSPDRKSVPAIKLFPNPTKGIVNLDGISGPVDVEIYSIEGRLVKRFAKQMQAFDISDLRDGIYLFSVRSDSGTGFQRIVKSDWGVY
jgi:beta-glucanase (GH16 family)